MAKKEANKDVKKDSSVEGLVFVGCLFILGAIGMLTGQIAAGWLAGLGFGFIGMAFVRMKKR